MMYKYSHTFSVKLNIFMVLSLLISSFVFPNPVYADSTITVDTNVGAINAGDGLCSLPEAITNANDNNQSFTDCAAGSENDTIQFSNNLGTATITLLSSLPNITDTDGLTINGGDDITINGNNIYQIFTINSNLPFSLNNLILINGMSAVYNDSGTLTVTNSTFSGNSSLYGGAIQNFGTLVVTNSIFSGNSSSGGGGGSSIYNSGTATITKSTFSNNVSTGASRGSIYNSGTATITKAHFQKYHQWYWML